MVPFRKHFRLGDTRGPNRRSLIRRSGIRNRPIYQLILLDRYNIVREKVFAQSD